MLRKLGVANSKDDGHEGRGRIRLVAWEKEVTFQHAGVDDGDEAGQRGPERPNGPVL